MGRYVEHLIREWGRTDIPFDRVLILAPGDVDGLDSSRLPLEIATPRPWRPLALWEQAVLPWAARRAAVLLCPAYTGPILRRGPMVVANHGIYEALPDEFPWWRRLRATPVQRLSARRADRVLANSQVARADMVRWFKTDAAKIDVVLPGVGEGFDAAPAEEDVRAATLRSLGATGPYVLFVGKLSRRRHVPNLIAGFARAVREHALPHRLLLVGPNPLRIPVAALAAEEGVADRVAHRSHLEHDDLALLYAGADVFVLPTIYEGISFTILEAMVSGTPVLAVQHPTLPETAGDACLTVPTPAVEELAAALGRLLTDEGLRASLAAAGREWARHFSWPQSAAETMRIIDEVAAPHDGRA